MYFQPIVSPDLASPVVTTLEEEVWAAGSGLQLVFLDSDASFPSDLHPANIHPMFVYIEVARQKASVKCCA